MDEQTNTSKNVIDHRQLAAATHGSVGIIALLLGVLTGRATAPTSTVDVDLMQVTSTALDRGAAFWINQLDPGQWRDARVVVINHDENTPCGIANQMSGPFYCPPSEHIYLDLSFLRAITGDLARAYVVAHELGHHVQKLRGEFLNRDSVAVELQADCYAGMWMHDEQLHKHLADGDLTAAAAEAAAVGDDRICPGCSTESWTHGSSEQRVAALLKGVGGSACR